jgi:hypothetical protein
MSEMEKVILLNREENFPSKQFPDTSIHIVVEDHQQGMGLIIASVTTQWQTSA